MYKLSVMEATTQTAHPFATKTADEYAAEAQRYAQQREDSFARCDTDGFLSQWADGLSSGEARAKVEIMKNGGRSDFAGLYEGDRRVRAKVIHTQFGTSWMLHDSERALIQKRGKKFLPCGEASRVLKKLGLAQRMEMDTAWVKIDGEGYGLSGRAWVSVFRCGDEWGATATLVQS